MSGTDRGSLWPNLFKHQRRELVSERDDLQMQQGARLDQEAKGVKERDDDGRHDCRLSENACNLN